jgi:hypothetical protein
MTAAAAQPHLNFDDPSKWVVRQNVPIFDEHDEFDADGKLVRRFDKKKLEQIAQNCNRREKDTGDVIPIAIGHTRSKDREELQPRFVGYARELKVGQFGPGKKLGILANFYFKPAHYHEAMTYPRRSIELWPGAPDQQIIDPVSLLRRTPQRDLGLLTDPDVPAETNIVPLWAKQFARGQAQGVKPVAYQRPSGKLFYSMPDDEDHAMPDSGAAMLSGDIPKPGASPSGSNEKVPNEDDDSPEDMDKAEKYYRCLVRKNPVMKHLHKKYAKECGANPDQYDAGAAPGGSNTFVPGMAGGDSTKKPMPDMTGAGTPPDSRMVADPMDRKGDEAARMQRDSFAIQYARVEVDLAELKQENAKLVAALQAEQFERKRARAEQRISQLEAERYEVDRSKLVEKFARMDEKDWDAEETYVRQYHKRDLDTRNGPPIGQRLDIAPAAGRTGKPEKYSKETRERAKAIAYERGIDDYKQALAMAEAEQSGNGQRLQTA